MTTSEATQAYGQRIIFYIILNFSIGKCYNDRRLSDSFRLVSAVYGSIL